MARMRLKTPRKADWSPTDDHARVSPGQIIKDRRQQLMLQQGELAYKLNYSNPNFISMLEMGWSKVPIDKAPLIAEALHMPVHWFIERVLADRDETNFYAYLFGPTGYLRSLFEADLSVARHDVRLNSAHEHVSA